MSREPLTTTIPRRLATEELEGQTFEDALSSWLFVNGLLGRVSGVASGATDGEEVEVTFHELDDLDEETYQDLRTVLGLDDIREEGDPCPHKDTTSHEDGTWTCDECGEDLTTESLDRLIGTIQDALTKAARHPAGSTLQASGVLEAAIWMTHAHRTAAYVVARTRVGYPSAL